MLRKREKLLITFYTTTDAMAMESLCKEHGVPGRIIPVPGNISADCGLGWCAEPGDRETVVEFMKAKGLKYQGVHLCMI